MENISGNDSMLPPPRGSRSSGGIGCGMVFLIVALIGSFFFNVVLCAGLFAEKVSDLQMDSHLTEKFHSGDKMTSDKVAVVKIEGAIMDGLLNYVHHEIDQAAADDAVKAVVVRVDSPGGSITASDDLLRRLENLRDGTSPKHPGTPKPLIVSMGGVCASGGYYVSMAAAQNPTDLAQPKIFAERTCITGSIGVYASLPNAKEMADKIGVKMELIKAGDIKGSGSPFHELTPQERQPWQEMVENAYKQFISVVETGRPVLKGSLTKDLFEPKKVAKYDDKGAIINADGGNYTRKLADGGIFTAQEAKEYKLIDNVGTLDQAIAEAVKQAGLAKWRAVTYEKPINLLTALTGAQAMTPPQGFLPHADFTPRLWYLLPAAEVNARLQQ
jgi:protease-4